MHFTKKTLRFLENKALWVVVDPWLNQPQSDRDKFWAIGIDLNQHNHIFLDKLRHDLNPVKNVIVYQLSNVPLHSLYTDYPRYTNIEEIAIDWNNYSHFVFCGMHYGACVHNAVKQLRQALPGNYYVKRDSCCLMPFENPVKYDQRLLDEKIHII